MTRNTALAFILLSAAPAHADVVFTPLIGDMGPGASTITFEEFDLGTSFGPLTPVYPPNPPNGLAVPGHDVVLQGTLPYAVLDLDASFPSDVQTGYFENNGMVNTQGSGAPQLFQVRFGQPVATAGLVLYNNFGTIQRFYGLQAYDVNGNVLANQTNIGVQATPEFLGFKSDSANIALLELTIPITFNSGARPFFDTITYRADNDSDGDGVADDSDSCSEVANPAQSDADGDGIGNACDADLNNDCIVNAADLGLLRAGFFGSDPVLDFNGDGAVNAGDLGIMKQFFFGVPGPSGLPNACAP